MKHIEPILLLLGLGGLWVASGYLLYNYVLATALAYFAFPLLVFGVLPYGREILLAATSTLLIFGVCWVAGYILVVVFHFPEWLAYSILPIILVGLCVIDSIITPESNAEEDKDGI